MDEANVSGPFPDPEVPDLDSAGRFVPPWVKYPNLRRGSMGWRMGAGEWYLNRSTGMLYYIPRPGEDMAAAEVELPILQVLVEGSGDLEHPVSNMRFEGLTFSHATWLGPSGSDGYVSDQSGFHLIAPDHQPNFIGMPGEHEPRRTSLVQNGHAITVRIRVSFISEFLCIIQPHPLAPGFMANRAGSVDESL